MCGKVTLQSFGCVSGSRKYSSCNSVTGWSFCRQARRVSRGKGMVSRKLKIGRGDVLEQVVSHAIGEFLSPGCRGSRTRT